MKKVDPEFKGEITEFIAPIKDTKNYVLFIQNNYNTFDNHFIIQDLKTLITE